jgi:hypothetical protein
MAMSSAGAVIVDHIDELEGAMHFAHTVMKAKLGEVTAAEIERHRLEFGWAGKVSSDLDDTTWLAAEEWRAKDESENPDDLCDLYIDFDNVSAPDGREPETWVGTFCGFAGAGLQFAFGSNLLNRREWKAVLRTEQDVINSLVESGFRCDLKDGSLTYPLSIQPSTLSQAFETEEFDDALRPIGEALSEISRARPLLDRLVAAIRTASAGKSS